MASLMIYPVVIIAMLAAIIKYNKELGFLGSVVVIVTGCLGVYVGLAFSDVVLSAFGFESGFPSSESGYYTLQGFVFTMMGVVLLFLYYAILKGTEGTRKGIPVLLFSASHHRRS